MIKKYRIFLLSLIVVSFSTLPLFFNYPIDIGIIFLVPLSILVFFRPAIGVAFLFFLLPFTFSATGISYIEILFAAIFALSVIGGIVRSIVYKINIYRSSFFLPIALFTFSCLISYIPAISNSVSSIFWLRRVFPFFLFLLAIPTFVELKINEKESFKLFLFSSFVIAFYNMAKILFHWYNNISLIAVETNVQALRVAGNGVYLMYMPLFAIFLLLANKKRMYRVVLHLLLLSSIVALLLSYTRSYWIGIFFSLLYLLIYLKPADKKQFVKMLLWQVILVFITFMLLYAASPLMQQRLGEWIKQRFFSIALFRTTLSGKDRLHEIKALVPFILKSPIWGYGLGATYTFYSVNPFSWGRAGNVTIWFSHNFFVYHLFATGVIGLGSFLFLLLKNIAISLHIYVKTRINESFTKFIIISSALIVGLMFTSFTSPQFMDKPSNLYVGVVLGIIQYKYGNFIAHKIRNKNE